MYARSPNDRKKKKNRVQQKFLNRPPLPYDNITNQRFLLIYYFHGCHGMSTNCVKCNYLGLKEDPTNNKKRLTSDEFSWKSLPFFVFSSYIYLRCCPALWRVKKPCIKLCGPKVGNYVMYDV